MNALTNPKTYVTLALLMLASLLPGLALAGSAPGVEGVTAFNDSTMFGPILGLVVGLATGTFGKTIAILTLVVTLVMGLPRGNIMGVLLGFGMAAAFWFGPGMLIGMFSATL
jgi:conjugal transfer pilus assembly protein TraA